MSIARNNPLIWLLLSALDLDVPLIPLESTYDWMSRKAKINRRQYRDSLKGLARRGTITIIKKQNQEFIKLTKKGALKILLEKAKIPKQEAWDGKWRLIIFDIPKEFNASRDHFRKLLKRNGFIKLQGSVFISPHPLSREAIEYLKEVGLIKFVRIMKIEELDDDSDLKKKFGL